MRQTYSSEYKKLKLKPSKIFEITAEISTYVHEQNVYHGRTCGMLFGTRKTIGVLTSVREEPCTIRNFTLAELVLSEDGKELTFKTYPHQKVFMDPTGLYEIAEKYKVINKNPKAVKSNFEEYKHHQWHNDGYRTARSRLTKSTPWKWKPKYTCNIDKHKIPPQ